jgi:hypothetical protein
MTEKKMMDWSLASIIINLESIVRIPVNGQWSIISGQIVITSRIILCNRGYQKAS